MSNSLAILNQEYRLKPSINIRSRKTQYHRPTPSSLTNLDNDISLTHNEYFLPRKPTQSPKRFRIRNNSMSKKPQNSSIEMKPRDNSVSNNNITKQFLNEEYVSSLENLPLEGFTTPKTDKTLSKNTRSQTSCKTLLDLFPKKANQFLWRSAGKGAGREQEVSANETITVQDGRRSGNSFYSKDNDTMTMTDLGSLTSLDQTPSGLENQREKRNQVGSKLRKIVRRPTPPSKIDKILAGINVLDSERLDTEGSSYSQLGSRTTFCRTFTSRVSGKLSGTGMKSTRGFNNKAMAVDEKISKMSIAEISKKLKEYGETINRQIISYKDVNIFNDMQKNYKLISGITEAEKNLVMRRTEEERRREVKKRFAKAIVKLVKKMKKLGLTIDNIIKDKALPLKPFEKPASAEFIKAAKMGNESGVYEALVWNRYLVYDFDTMKQTALHWATKRNQPKIMKLLLENGADPDARDITGRTPLFLAAKNLNIVGIKILLMHGANPLIKSDSNKTPADYTSDITILHLLRRAIKIHSFLEAQNWQKAQTMWENLDLKEFQVRDDDLE